MLGVLKRVLRPARRIVAGLSVDAEPDRAVHWGIAQWRIGLGGRASQAATVRVRVQVSGGPGAELTAAPQDGELRLGVHTHLLANGQHTLSIEVLEGTRSIGATSIRLEVFNGGPLAATVADCLRRHGVAFAFVGPCDASRYPWDDDAVRPWFDRPDALQTIERRAGNGEITADDAALLRQFVEQGYILLEGLIDDATVDAVNAEIDDAVAKRWQGYEYGSSQRIEQLHARYPAIRRLWTDRRHLRVLDMVFGAQARPCQTLTYVFGSQQDAHQDTVHLTSFPAGYMCGTWIALQDVVPDSGELVIYPGSHREPRIYMKDAGCAKVTSGDWSEFGAKVVPMWAAMAARHAPVVYRPRKGTVLIWHENLLHAGSVRADASLPRRSIVVHSFAQGAIVFYDSSGSVGDANDPDAA